jgi:putative ABC transport system substrate-binding protein
MEFRDSAGLDAALDSAVKQSPQAVVQLGSPLIRQGADHVAQVLSARGIPAISQFRTYPDGGGLMSYGPDLTNLYRRVSYQVSAVLKGARPAELPIERPTKFELIINMKAAKALGVAVPGSLLALADEVIE